MYIIKTKEEERLFFDVQSIRRYLDRLSSYESSDVELYKIKNRRKKRIRISDLHREETSWI